MQFARHGIPEVLISNNGPEFDNQEFKNFFTDWQFKHRTSSPRYPQANGKWKIPWRPAKDSSWKRRKTNETHYWQSSDGATPQVRDSEPHQYKGWWVGAHTPCYQLLKSYSSQAVTWGPQREAWPLGKDYSASSTTVLQSHEGGRGNPNETTWGTEMEIRLLLTSSWPTLVWSSGRWTVLPQKPPPAALHPGALTSAK